jgi:hypothetical protein
MRAGRAAERTILGVLLVWGLAPIVLIALHALSAGLRMTGADGVIGADQLQYLAWARDAGSHGLASNLFELSGGGHVFLQPMFELSGLVWRLGVPLQLAYLLWKPIAVLVLFAGTAAWVARLVDGHGARVTALVIALFLFTPLAAIAGWAEIGSAADRNGLLQLAGEVQPAGQLWGYLPSAIAIGLMPIALLAIARAARDGGPGGDPRTAGASLALGCGAALLVAWLHPWQGATMLVMFVALAAWGRLRDWRVLAPAAVAVGSPLLYYLLLSKLDAAWKLAGANEIVPHLSAAALLAGLVPVLALAWLGVRRPGDDLLERALLLWIPAAVAVYFATSSFPSHALEGISLPASVLIARGLPRAAALVRGGAIASATAALLLVGSAAGMAYEARAFHRAADAAPQQYYLNHSEARTLDWLGSAKSPKGGVLAPLLLSIAIPSQTGRHVWVGHEFWSRDYVRRAAAVAELFGAGLSAQQAQALVALSGARIVVTGCDGRTNLSPQLRPLIGSTTRFGCAAAYTIRGAL